MQLGDLDGLLCPVCDPDEKALFPRKVHWDLRGPFVMAFAGLVLWSLFYMAVLYPCELVAAGWAPGSLLRPLAFPLLYTAFYALLSFTPLGTYFCPSTALSDFGPLAQLASVVGAVGLLFLPAWLVSAAVDYLLSCYRRRPGASELPWEDAEAEAEASLRNVRRASLGAVLLLSYGAWRPYAGGGWFQRDITTWAPKELLSASCLLGRDRAYGEQPVANCGYGRSRRTSQGGMLSAPWGSTWR